MTLAISGTHKVTDDDDVASTNHDTASINNAALMFFAIAVGTVLVCLGMVWYGMVWYGMVWSGMVWYGMVWYGMILKMK